MVAAPSSRPARVVAVDGRRWWRCPGCGKTLGELREGRVVVKVGDRRLSLPAMVGLDQTCPACLVVSELVDDP